MLMMVGLGSFAGGILRFLLSRFVQVNSASSFPWGTAAVNLLGCFILGALYGLFDRNLPHTETRLFLTAGLCGGFTTFSTLMKGTSPPSSFTLSSALPGGSLPLAWAIWPPDKRTTWQPRRDTCPAALCYRGTAEMENGQPTEPCSFSIGNAPA